MVFDKIITNSVQSLFENLFEKRMVLFKAGDSTCPLKPDSAFSLCSTTREILKLLSNKNLHDTQSSLLTDMTPFVLNDQKYGNRAK